jgi:hypothetical protein
MAGTASFVLGVRLPLVPQPPSSSMFFTSVDSNRADLSLVIKPYPI